MRCALLQTDPQPHDLDGNVRRALALMDEAAAAGAELVVLPEMWPRTYVDALRDDQGPTVDWRAVQDRWAEHTAKLGLTAIGGLPLPAPGDPTRVTNSLLVLGPDGAERARYDKLHLFTYMHEERRFAPGDALQTVAAGGLTFGLTICYDLRFPELYRALRGAGADVLVTIAQWPTARVAHWDLLLRARAVENLCYAVGVNRTGAVPHQDAEIAFPGHSAVIGPWGEELALAGTAPGVTLCELDARAIAERRAAFPNWTDRRLDPHWRDDG